MKVGPSLSFFLVVSNLSRLPSFPHQVTFQNNVCHGHSGTVYAVQDQPSHHAVAAITASSGSADPNTGEVTSATPFDMTLPVFKRRIVFRNNIAPLKEGKIVWGIAIVLHLLPNLISCHIRLISHGFITIDF